MPRGTQLTDTEKAKIEAFREAGKGYGYIANKLGRSKAAIQKFVTKLGGYGQKTRKGRPRKLSKRDEHQISRAMSNSTKSLNQIKRGFQLNVSKSTIFRAIQRNPNIVREKMKSAPKLKDIRKHVRLEFARNNMNRNWKLVRLFIGFFTFREGDNFG